jgi:hypothetical protein
MAGTTVTAITITVIIITATGIAKRSAVLGSVMGLVAFSSVAVALSPGAPPSTFPNEPEARRHCPADIVVWLDPTTGIFYYRDQRWYGNIKGGAFACRNEVGHASDRAPASGQQP